MLDTLQALCICRSNYFPHTISIFFAVAAKMLFIFLFFPITFLSLFLHCHPQPEAWRESLSPVPGIQFSFAPSPVSRPLFHWFTNPLSLLPWGHLRALPLCFYHSLTSVPIFALGFGMSALSPKTCPNTFDLFWFSLRLLLRLQKCNNAFLMMQMTKIGIHYCIQLGKGRQKNL